MNLAPEKIADLLKRLADPDQMVVRSAGNELLRLGAAVLPDLIDAIRVGPPEARRSAAFLIGKLGPSPTGIGALRAALSDQDPKVRKNAAVAIGAVGTQDDVPVLVQTLASEKLDWVRPSVVLAIGRIGGDAAVQFLGSVVPSSEKEREALRKALDRAVHVENHARWKSVTSFDFDLFGRVPSGFEDVAIEEADAAGLGKPSASTGGLLRFGRGLHPQQLVPRLRCLYGPQILVAKVPFAHSFVEEQLLQLVDDLLKRVELLPRWRDWIDLPGTELPVRFSLVGVRTSKKTFLDMLQLLRSRLARHHISDHPSNYVLELQVDVAKEGIFMWALPMLDADTRFRYRVQDVGASLNPVVGACLARLVRTGPASVVIDPTCGSATLLIERAMLDSSTRLKGIDISPTAHRAAIENISEAKVADRVSITQGDSEDAALWLECDEAVMNLPFGLRSARQDRDLSRLYASITANLARFLRPTGRAVVYTANAHLFVKCLSASGERLHVIERRETKSGGLRVYVFVLGRALSRGQHRVRVE